MTAADFHGLAANNDASKAERLFRASVSAFCSLTRPSRREVAQLDDLTLPLYPHVSVEARRFVAAALSECRIAPTQLVDRLADDRIDIAAPLLMRSALLSDVDLIALVGRHGLSHARAIARRPGLNPTIKQLIRALEASVPAKSARSKPLKPASSTAAPQPVLETETVMPSRNAIAAASPLMEIAKRQVRGQAAEAVRQRLRQIMQREPIDRAPYVGRIPDAQTFPKLRDAAFTGDPIFFQTVLGDALGMSAASTRRITETSSYSPLLAALRALDLGEEQAFMLAAAIFPTQFAHPEAIRLFATRYRSLDQETAADRVRGWRLEALANKVQWEEARKTRA